MPAQAYAICAISLLFWKIVISMQTAQTIRKVIEQPFSVSMTWRVGSLQWRSVQQVANIPGTAQTDNSIAGQRPRLSSGYCRSGSPVLQSQAHSCFFYFLFSNTLSIWLGETWMRSLAVNTGLGDEVEFVELPTWARVALWRCYLHAAPPRCCFHVLKSPSFHVSSALRSLKWFGNSTVLKALSWICRSASCLMSSSKGNQNSCGLPSEQGNGTCHFW